MFDSFLLLLFFHFNFCLLSDVNFFLLNYRLLLLLELFESLDVDLEALLSCLLLHEVRQRDLILIHFEDIFICILIWFYEILWNFIHLLNFSYLAELRLRISSMGPSRRLKLYLSRQRRTQSFFWWCLY